MFITDLALEQSGSVRNVTLEHLCPGMTVIWGPNGSGKTTLVRFLRGVLHGFHGTGNSSLGRETGTGGSMRIRHHQDLLTLARQIGSSGDQPLTITITNGERPMAVRHDQLLPAWVTENVFRDVFTVGYEEAEQFDLLVRLCLECGDGVSSAAEEIRLTEQALFQIARDRDGDASQRGLTARIGEQRQRIDRLCQELAALRRAPSDLTQRIRLQASEAEALSAQTDRIQVRIGELSSRIEQLELMRSEWGRRNILPLDRDALESEIRILTARQSHWRRIHEAISAEIGASGEQQGWWQSVPQPQDSLKTVRALVQRIEERVQALGASLGRNECSQSRDGYVQECGELQTETNALCCYLSQHELAVSRNAEFLDQLFAERCLRDTTRVEWLLEQRLTVLRAELRHCDNVLAEQAIPAAAYSCSQPGHHAGVVSGVRDSAFRTVQQIEDELEQCVAERTRLQAERNRCGETRQAALTTLERLQQELSGSATLEHVDALRVHLAEAEARVVLLEDQRRQLADSEESLREVIFRLRQLSQSRVLELASAWLARLTQGECTQIVCRTGAAPVLQVQTIHGVEPFRIEQLSRGARHQLALALRLALIRVRSESGEHVPLVLDDVFITSDDARAYAAVELLSEVAAAGQQILFLTCQRDVRDLFARFHADVRTIGQRREEPAATAPTIPATHLKAYVEDLRMAVPTAEVAEEAAPATVAPATVAPAAVDIPVSAPMLSPSATPATSDSLLPERPTDEVAGLVASSANWLFYLETDRGIDDLAGISLSELEALRSGGIRTIADLLENPVARIEESTRARGFLLSAERLDALRGQAELACRVPMLRCGDAALLYAAGIRTVEELRKLRPEAVFDRVVTFQKTSEGSRFRRSGRLIDRQQAINWARCGQHSRLMAEAATSRSRFFARGAASASPQSGDEAGPLRTQRRMGNRQETAQSVRRRLINEPLDASQRRARRLARRRQLASGLRAASTTERDADRSVCEDSETAVSATTIGGRHLRFFLNRASDIASAPSVGPATAQALKQQGIRNVDDLLSHSAERLAKLLNQSRITAAVIEQWQAQAKLMCQVPELRCHDVQLLVACGLSDPDELARRNPAELLSIIVPFASSKAGERILRKGRKPDLEEVTNWIKWAGCARTLRAA